VLPVLRYHDLDDAIARANDTDYGLGCTVWSSDSERAFDVARRIDAGVIWINKHHDLPPDIPIGGAKQSAIGAELGREGLEEFTQAKTINMAKQRLQPYWRQSSRSILRCRSAPRRNYSR
jgi:acyl-CoA reductase-like NAD-dependent aldehyde dehydrogenase